MTKEETFRAAAKSLVDSFSTGTHTITAIGTESYSTTTGAVSRTSTTFTLPAARYNNVEDNSYPETYSNFDCIFAIAGSDLGLNTIKIGDSITAPDSSIFLINKIKTDQYKAAFFLYCNKQ
jgi:hypothetical protein